MKQRHAEIVGAGFAGLTAACALAQRGWSVRVHERAERLRATGTGIYIYENGLRVLEAVGAYEAAVANMALLNFAGKAGSDASSLPEGSSFVGAHHFGFQVEDLAETQRRIEQAGGKFYFDLGSERQGNFERKFKDPDGVMFDISQHGWAGTEGRK